MFYMWTESEQFGIMSMTGMSSELQDAIPEVQIICRKIRPHAEIQAGKNYYVFIAVKYKTQLVNGTNYFIKVHVGGDEYVHLRVYESLPHAGSKLELCGIQMSKTRFDPVEFF
ncbi:cystatin-B-like [Denticeps clupeoides]|uniref:Cystatin-B n=1 Tax=Denticeps clupeoides TaxID=299321 RepID=A0AAY4BZE5_9TELE|nr:cystatin-B-like [Denticeps clupeoides]